MTPIVMPPRTEKPEAEMTPVQAAQLRVDIEAELEADRGGGWCGTFVVLGLLMAAAGAALVLAR